MKYILPLLLFFLNTPTVKAQLTTNAYWTTQTEMSVADVIYYDVNKSLEWQDFRGKPNTGGIIAAITSSGFGYKASLVSKAAKGELNIAIYCYFSKDKSWVKSDRKTDYILTHEQHHFDISFIAAKVFMERLKATTITTSNCNSVLPRIYKECCDLMNKLQDDYDGQTRNGQLKEVQAKWNTYLDDQIKVFIK